MGRPKFRGESLVALVVAVSVVLSSCGGSGGGGGGGTGSSPAILLITADGATVPLWNDATGAPPVCPSKIFVNSEITFTFGGAVLPSSLPPDGIAQGSINILSFPGSHPAQGTFAVEDDPALPAGNQRRVVFRPMLPNDPNAGCGAGLGASQVYNVAVPRAGTAPLALIVDGLPLANDAIGCFETCGCPNPLTCTTPFLDRAPGPPFVLSTTPVTSDPAPSPVDPCSIAGNTIQILVNEALSPSGIDLSSVRVVSLATGAQIPGSLVFHQAWTLPGLGSQSQIDYVASSPLPDNTTFQILLGPSVTDLVGNPIQTSAANPAALLFFQTPTGVSSPHQVVESFDAPYPGGASGAFQWTGNGLLEAVFPLVLTGDGSEGPFNPPSGVTTLLDTNETVGGQSRQGIWNFTDVTIQAGATVRIIGPYLAHIRCTGSFTLNGSLSVNAGTGNPALGSTPAYDKGPEPGLQNNNFGMNCEANGGVANAGGGAGGTGSGVTPPPGSPSNFQCALRAFTGENGYGPTINGTLNTGTPANSVYAAGQGGDGGCFPSIPFSSCVPGDLGGLGGAGGTSGRLGEAGIPRQATVACLPLPSVVQPIAQPSPISIAMIPPITLQSAGSGGGGGGDHFDTIGVPPNNDDQGGGAGGGGGGLRISCVGPYSQGTATAAGLITALGAQGAVAQSASGAGGSGSGGEVWIQSFSTVTITANSSINVDGPIRVTPVVGGIGCSNWAAGGGGDGLVQIEAGQGPTPTPSFMLFPTPTPTSGAVFSAPPFPFAGSVTGHGMSDFLWTQTSAPDYTSVVVVSSLGNAPGATLTIRFEGAQEAVNSTPQSPFPDPATIKTMATGGGPITAANIDELDGYAFIKWIADVSFPAPPTTPANAMLPFVDSITINYNSVSCP